MKPYQKIPIQECGDPLMPIPLAQFSVETPHPYEKLGADYQEKSPYFLRQTVVEALLNAQSYLQQQQDRWKIHIFDAYRPVTVQQFMVDYTFKTLVADQGLSVNTLSAAQQQMLWENVYQIWAIPSDDPATPPPHSTGAAIDITLIDETGRPLDMGGAIDELSARSQPNYYAQSCDRQEQLYHQRRELLHQIMGQSGFCRHPGEWWHFSLGDQMWAWQTQHPLARYGRV